jgi:regulatory protein
LDEPLAGRQLPGALSARYTPLVGSQMVDQSPPRLLTARALRWLAQREYSRSELRRRLLAAARRDAESSGQSEPAAATAIAESVTAGQLECQIDELLDWLSARNFLSEPRFVASRIRLREQRFGNLRIRRELADHGVSPDAADAERLRETEFERAKAVWARRFGEPACDAAGRARQARFLAGRGFSAEVIRRLVDGRRDQRDDA